MTPSQPNPVDQPLRVSKARQKDQAILAMLQSPTLEKAAQTVGIHPSTLRRWWKNPEFRRRYEEAKDAAFLQAKGWLQQGCQAAVGTVFQIMRDNQVAASTRLQAAKYVLDQDRRSARYEADRKPELPSIKVTFVKPSDVRAAPKTCAQSQSKTKPDE